MRQFFGSVWRAHWPATIRLWEHGKRLMIKRNGRSQLCESPSRMASSAEKSCRCSNPRRDRTRFVDGAKASGKGWSFVGGRANSRSRERQDLSRHAYSFGRRAKTRSARVHWRIRDRSQPELATAGVAKRSNMMSHFEGLT